MWPPCLRQKRVCQCKLAISYDARLGSGIWPLLIMRTGLLLLHNGIPKKSSLVEFASLNYIAMDFISKLYYVVKSSRTYEWLAAAPFFSEQENWWGKVMSCPLNPKGFCENRFPFKTDFVHLRIGFPLILPVAYRYEESSLLLGCNSLLEIKTFQVQL